MGNDQKLCFICKAPHILRVAADVFFIQRRFDLVHDAERRRTHFQDREIQRDRDKGLFSAGQKADRGDGLAGRLDPDVDAAVQDVVFILEDQGRFAAAEEVPEGVPEASVPAGIHSGC